MNIEFKTGLLEAIEWLKIDIEQDNDMYSSLKLFNERIGLLSSNVVPAKTRREFIINYLKQNQLEGGHVHISSSALAKRFEVSIGAIAEDIKQLLLDNKIEYYCKEASMFTLL